MMMVFFIGFSFVILLLVCECIVALNLLVSFRIQREKCRRKFQFGLNVSQEYQKVNVKNVIHF